MMGTREHRKEQHVVVNASIKYFYHERVLHSHCTREECMGQAERGF